LSGTAGAISPTGIALDPSGNICVAGYYTGTANFGGSTFTSAGQQDAFIAKYSPQGQHLWSQSFGGVGSDVFNGVDVDSQGNFVAIGWFQALYPATVSFGGTGLYSTRGAINVIVAKYSPSGACLWSKSFANAGSSDYGYGIAVDKRTNLQTGLPYDTILLTGSYYNWIDFGGGQLTAASSSYEDLFVAKLSASGSYIWARNYGGAYTDRASSITFDANGDAVVAGAFWNQTSLGGGSITGTATDEDMFLAKYSGTDGSYVWAKPLLGNYGGWTTSVKCDPQNNVILTGYYYGSFNFGAQTLSSVANSYDLFVAKYSSSATPLWASSFGGTGTDKAFSVVADGTGHVVTAGVFNGTVTFGATTLTSAGSNDAFLLRMNP
jgi:hypothetical protein